MDPNDEPEEDGANVDLDAHRKGKCAVVKTSTRQVICNYDQHLFLIDGFLAYGWISRC